MSLIIKKHAFAEINLLNQNHCLRLQRCLQKGKELYSSAESWLKERSVNMLNRTPKNSTCR